MAGTVLTTERLTKRYGQQTAVNGLDLTVQQGDIYGFLGPNGAGKTTTLRMALGLIRPTSGQVRLLGQDPFSAGRALFRQVGSLIEGPGFWPHLSAAENLAIMQRLGGGERREIDEVLDLVGLAATGRKPLKQFSLGMKQRLGIAMALLGRPRLLVLDEPTNGLDPEGFREIRALLKGLVADRGMTILLSSHLLTEVEQVATRIGVIRQGRMVTQAAVADLRQQGGILKGPSPLPYADSGRGISTMSVTYRLLRGLARLFSWFWAPLEVHHRERIPAAGPVVIVANHRSLIDGVLMLAFCDRPVAFVGAAYLFDIPVVCSVIRQVATPTGSVPGMRQTLAHLERGHMVALFPEGGVRESDSLADLGDIAAFMASKTGAVVVPIAMEGAGEVLPLGKLFPRRRRKVRLLVGEPRTVAPGLKRADLLKITTEWMAELYAMNRP